MKANNWESKKGGAKHSSLRSKTFLWTVVILALFIVCNIFFGNDGIDGIGTAASSNNEKQQQQQQQQQQQLQQQPSSTQFKPQPTPTRDISAYQSILPKRIYSVIGLESSGTRFVTQIVKDALQTGKNRNGVFAGPEKTKYRGGTKDVWVQHLSLPWGGNCKKQPIPQILPIILPGVCSSGLDEYREPCQAIAKDANMTFNENGKPNYPKRWLLDMIQHRDFYESVGVRTIYVVILRDSAIARKGRVEHKYCTNETMLLLEEEIGTNILKAAIRKYLLQDGHGGSGSGSVLTGNDFVLISYESLMRLGDVYVEMLFQALGIESNVVPELHDGNPKYVLPTEYETP